jgi:hypothetical protein
MPQQIKIYIDFVTSANHLSDLVRWEGNGLTMPKDKIRQPKLEKTKQNEGTSVVTHYKTIIVGL